MFTLINEMETTIKINTSIIFGNGSHLTGAKFNCLTDSLTGWGWGVLHIHERVLRALPFVACGASSEFPLVYFKMAAVKRDTTQTSSSIHTLDAVYNVKYLCGNIITIQIYWQWQQGIRASLCVPQDERVFLSLAPEVLRGMDCVTSWQRPRSTKTRRRRQWEAGGFNRRQGREEETWKCVENAPIRTINMHPGCWL